MTVAAWSSAPNLRASLELLKPITWFPPMWAYGCGAVSIAKDDFPWLTVLAGIVLAGPLLCGTSQAVNDWFDRHVDAINEPQRPIPSGRLPGNQGLLIACLWSALSLSVAALLGQTVFLAATLGLALAWAYSAPPIRLKANGWLGNAACGFSYETLPWLTGAAVMASAGWPDYSLSLLTIATLYGLGAHGIMTLNDFKALEGDRCHGVSSLPVRLGPARAARLACLVMALPQLGVIFQLLYLGLTLPSLLVTGLLAGQLLAMPKLLRDPQRFAPWYNGVGVTLYVLGMLASALALRTLSS
jgi:chlorophyll synthase